MCNKHALVGVCHVTFFSCSLYLFTEIFHFEIVFFKSYACSMAIRAGGICAAATREDLNW